MKAVSKDQFRKDIIDYFKKQTGLTVSQAKKQIKSVLTIDKYGNTENNSIIAGNVKLFYTNNDNYCQGKKYGYGKGWYLSNVGFTGGSIVKV